MATGVQVGPVNTTVPGPYTNIDDSGLAQPAAGSVGSVALIGTATSGRPISAMTKISQIPTMKVSDDVLELYRSGDLREGANILFSPGSDEENIPGGAQLVYGIRVNPATKSTAALGSQINLESKDWGVFTNQINIAIASGTVRGKKVTIKFEGTTETLDNLGGTGTQWMTATYRRGTNGYDRVTLAIATTGQFTAAGERDAAGAAGLITTQLAANGVVAVGTNVDNATARGLVIIVYGLDAAGDPQTEEITTDATNSTTFVPGVLTFSRVYGVELPSAITTAVLQVRATNGSGAIIFDVPAGTLREGVIVCDQVWIDASGFTAQADSGGAETGDVIFFGTDVDNADLNEVVTLTSATPVSSVGTTYTRLNRIVTGNVASARTVTVKVASAVATDVDLQDTVQKVADYFNARSAAGPIGFALVIATGQVSAHPEKFDAKTATSILNPAVLSLYADRYAIIDEVNRVSALIVMSAGSVGAAPSNTTTPVYLRGAIEGTVTSTQWLAAFTLLRKLRVNSVVPISGDPAVHALAVAHRAYVAGQGRNEQDVFVGLMNTALTDVPTKDEAKAAAVLLNSKGVRAVGQAITRFNTSLESEEFMPPFAAVLLAGMQAGAPVGTSLTYKYANVRDVRGDTSWDPIDDGDEMIRAGLVMIQPVDQVGFRVVRNITTYLKDNNLGRIEGSVVQVLDHCAFRLRAAVDSLTAKRGLTEAKVKAAVTEELGRQIDDGIIVSYDPANVKVIFKGDKAVISVPVAPEIPKNFIVINIQPRLAA